MDLWKLLFGQDAQTKQFSTQTPEQNDLLMQLIQGLQGGQSNIPGMNYLQSLFSDDPSAFEAYEAPLKRQFNEQIVPGLAERFTGMGMGGSKSSAFQQQLAGAGSRLTELLGSQRANLRQGALGQIGNFFGQAQRPTYENVYSPAQSGLLGQAGGEGLNAIMQKLMSRL